MSFSMNPSPEEKHHEWWYYPLIIVSVIFGAYSLLSLAVFGYKNYVYSEGVAIETGLSAQYMSCVNDLSTTMVAFKEQWAIYAESLKGIDKYVSDAISGRYDQRTSTGLPTGQINAEIWVSAIGEAYPDVSGHREMALKMMDFINARRTGFQQCQDKTLDMIRSADNFYNTGLIHRQVVAEFGFPSDLLVAPIDGTELTGKAALKHMRQLVVYQEARKAFDSGQMEPMEVPTLHP